MSVKMSVLRGAMSIWCPLWLLFAGQVVCHRNASLESQCTNMLFRTQQDLGTVLSDVKMMGMYQSQHYEDLSAEIGEMKTGQSEHSRDVSAEIDEMKDMMANLTDMMETMKDMITDIKMLQSDNYREISGKTDLIYNSVAGEGCRWNATSLNWISVLGGQITVPCDGLGWIVLMRRVDAEYNFPERNWEDYKIGFGDHDRSFWLGLENMYLLTSSSPATLRVDLLAFDGESRYAEYANFRIEGEEQGYRLRVSGYTGTAGDSLANHDGWKFSTIDKDQDGWTKGNCAEKFKGAWWYNRCHHSNLNSVYTSDETAPSYGVGLNWYHWKGHYYSYKTVSMKLLL